MGKLIAIDENLQTYENWIAISADLEAECFTYDSWIKNISPANINKEKIKIAAIPIDAKLSALASFRGRGADNEAEAQNYIAYIEKSKAQTAIEYILHATRDADLLHLSDSLILQRELLHNAGLSDWILFTDSLRYPILQDHNFLSIQSIDEYPSIIRFILSDIMFITPKEHLLIIALENYYEFADRTVCGIHQVFDGRNADKANPAKKTAIETAKLEYDNWMNVIIPASFVEIMNIIFPHSKLHESPFFNIFFEWINTHSGIFYVHPSVVSKVKLLEMLNDLFQKRLDIDEEDRHILVDNLKPIQVNFEALKKLVSVLETNKSDLLFRDKLYNTYIKFIKDKEFNWIAKGNVDFGGAINNAYYFAQVLNCYPDAFKKWEALLITFKTVHEGWLKSQSDSRAHYREPFLFCSGIGIAYNHYYKKDAVAGREVLFNVFDLLIRHIRNSSEMSAIDYETPIRFSAITIGSFDSGSTNVFLKIIMDKTDKVKYALIALNELIEYEKVLLLSDELKLSIVQKIDAEFWIIELKKSESPLKNELDYYVKLRDKALSVCG